MDCLAETGADVNGWAIAAIAAGLLIAGVWAIAVSRQRSRKAGVGALMLVALIGGLALAGQGTAASYALGTACGGSAAPQQSAQQPAPAAPANPAPGAGVNPGGGDPGAPVNPGGGNPGGPVNPGGGNPGGPVNPGGGGQPFQMESADWSQPTIPATDACTSPMAPGTGRSPAISWNNPPAGTVAYAITLVDADATFLHWEVLNYLTATPASLSAGASGTFTAPTTELVNDFGRPGYGGPCPPPGAAPHHYVLTVYALSRTVTGAADIAAATLGQVQLTGLYRQ